MGRKIKYSDAIREAHVLALRRDENVFVMGQGVDNPWCVGSSTKGVLEEFGPRRVRDVPISENAMTGAAIGAAMAGMRPIVFHPRMDFMYLAMDQIFNHCAHWYYMFGGQVNVPVTIRGIINRGGEQAAQHSQSPYAMYAHVPGIKVVLPSAAREAKGLLLAAVEDDNPVLYIDDRWLYDEEGDVPEEYFVTPIGKALVRREGSDVTVVAISSLVREALSAATALENEGMSVEVVDPLSIRPLDRETICASVAKTGRLLVADPAWPCFGAASEIISTVAVELFGKLKAPPARVTLPDAPAPASVALEDVYYPKHDDISRTIRNMLRA